MNIEKSLKTEIYLSAILIGIILASRFSSHLWNFTAVGGVSLFAGAYFSKKYLSVVTVFLGLFISDVVIGLHEQMPAVYFSYALMIGLGFFLDKNPPRRQSAAFAIVGSILFFVITNFAVWLEGLLYPMTVSGLFQSYTMALPFFRTQVISDLLSAVILFEIAQQLGLFVKPSAANSELPGTFT